jgi:hypothetical protein
VKATIDFFGLGVDEYTRWGRADRNLTFASIDCLKVEHALKTTGLLAKSVAVTTQGAVRPALLEVYCEMEKFLTRKHARRDVVFYFSGHGFTTPDGQMNICCSDFNPAIAAKAGIKVADIVKEFNDRFDRGIYIFDCCRAPFGKSADSDLRQKRHSIPVQDGSVAVFSCSETEHSYEVHSVGGGLGAGIFSHFLCASIKEHWTLPSRAQIPFSRIFEDTKRNTLEYAKERGAKQTPRMLGDRDFPLSRAKA